MMTGVGMLLGTAAYMAPEQAKGKPADKRSDIWGFGCVLFEMLSGRSPFAGVDVSETLAFVITRPPAWEALPPQTPPAIRRLLERTLRKSPATRLQHIGDARIELDDAMSGAEAKSPTGAPGAGARSWARTLALAAATLAMGTVAGIVIARAAFAPEATGGAISLAITPPLETALAIDPIDHDFAVTPDGTRVVYISSNRGSLVVRSLDRVEPQVLVRDAVALRHPFISPDGQWIGYFEGPVATLKKASSRCRCLSRSSDRRRT
jgi:serine/threonine-protein kinase